jgi:hypothetical protein
VTDVDEALDRLRTVCRKACDAEEARDTARADRRRILEQKWEHLRPLGYKLMAAQVGPSTAASTLRTASRGLLPRTPRGPRFSPSINDEQRAALAELREVSVRLVEAEKALKDALNERHFAIRAAWPVVGDMGAAKVARSLGDRLVGESTIRQAVADLQRA